MISLDTNVFIYALEGSSEFATTAQELLIKAEKEGCIVSVLVKQELLTGIIIKSPQHYAKVVEVLDSLQNITFVPVTNEIIEESLKLTKTANTKIIGYDAVHLATALIHGVDTFYTNDEKIKKLHIDGLFISELSS
jgi:predicted nucleic acid-binding protein